MKQLKKKIIGVKVLNHESMTKIMGSNGVTYTSPDNEDFIPGNLRIG